ncbi:hypothetical protein J5X84_15415 [Streptosporangiaceae bacterium NEAU-GS5]|nr:hypothetical protein [Streptosporangiaceae bacterium NEAU-GS5]
MIKRIATIVLAGAISSPLLLMGRASAAPDDLTFAFGRRFPAVILIDDRPVTITSSYITNAVDVSLTIKSGNVNKTSRVFHRGQTWTFQTTFLPSDPVGAWSSTVVATGAESSTQRAATVFLQHHTRIADFSARPRVILAGHATTVSGRLQVQIHHRWVALAGREIRIIADSGTAPPPVTTAVTDGHGRFSIDVTPDKDTRYHAEFTDKQPPENEDATSRTIFVKVIKPHSGEHRR